MHFDVIIIGAGPGGCAAAIACRMHGFHTLMISCKAESNAGESHEIQPSESIHPGVISVLEHLNAAHCVQVASQGVYEGIETKNQYNPLGEDEYGLWQGHHINRKKFDEALLNTAEEQGVVILKNDAAADLIYKNNRVAGVKTKTGMQLTCLYVIDASGNKRMAGKKSGFKESYYSPPLVAWTGVSKNISSDSFLFEKRITRFIPHIAGWTWLAPELPDRCTWTRLELKGKQQFSPPVELKSYSLAAKIKISNRRWRVFRPVCKEGVILCGDAAGIIDPAAGQGILNAIVSASMAAKTIKACASNVALEAVYLAQYDDWFINGYLNKVNRLKHFYAMHGITIF